MELVEFTCYGRKVAFYPPKVTYLRKNVKAKQSDWLRCRNNPDGIVATAWTLIIGMGTDELAIDCACRNDLERLYKWIVKQIQQAYKENK